MRSILTAPAVGRLALAAFGLAFITTKAEAGEAPLYPLYGTTQPDTEFQIIGQSDYQDLKMYAPAGQDAWIGLGVRKGWALQGQLFDPSGVMLWTFQAGDGSAEGDSQTGAEIHSSSSGGYYTLRVSPVSGEYYDFPIDAYAWYWPDCRGGPATQCTIAPGKIKAGWWGGNNDGDSFLIKAPAGRRYAATLTITSGQYRAYLSVLNRVGKVLASGSPLTFTLPRSGGPYYLKALATSASHAGRGTYNLTLKQP